MTEDKHKNPSYNKKRIYSPFVISIVLACGILLGYFLSKSTTNKVSVLEKYEYNKIEDVLDYIEYNYVDSIDRETLEDKAIEELLTDLDPHSVYIPSSEIQTVTEDLQGNFEGIGVQFRIRKDTINIEATIQDGPSEKIGIMPGDKIIYVEDSLVAGVGITNSDVLKLLKGPKGTKVKVGILRKGEILPFHIIRDKIPIYSIDVSYMMRNHTGYMKINRFSATTYDEFMEHFDKFKENDIEHLILDLRGNPGGFLLAAVEIIDEFLSGKKLVVYTEGLNQAKRDYLSKRKGIFEEGTLVVLVDQYSASASEILAGAIQDWDRGTIIGRRTFGKGLVQEQHAFPDTSALRLTIARYYTPSGRSIQRPYDDKEHYYDDIGERYDSGELLGVDSSNLPHQDTIIYYTKLKNRKVYGGGGIAPDIFVPIDTSYANIYVSSLRQYIQPFLQRYYDNNAKELERYNVENFATAFRINDNLYKEFLVYAKASGFNHPFSDNEAHKKGIKLLLKANLAKRLFKNEGFYRVVNNNSLIIDKAFEIIQTK